MGQIRLLIVYMQTRPAFPVRELILWAAALVLSPGNLSAQPRVLDAARYHLGVAGFPEWEWFQGRTPFSNRLDLEFLANSNPAPGTLLLRQEDVKLDWTVQINGRKAGKLFLMEEPLVHTIAVPVGYLRDGTNVLSVLPANAPDDIWISDIQFDPRPVRAVLSGAQLEVQVTEAKSRRGLPCRITIVDERGDLAALEAIPGQELAVRPGVVYSADGNARLWLLPGRYTVFANRGFEYSLARKKISLLPGVSKRIQMQITREVSTSGWVASDTHVHTFSYARHGDATIEERMLTLAGEGIELPISTEHNQLVDFSPAARAMKVKEYFTPVLGCEVTTASGHFNAWPFRPAGAAPDYHLQKWSELMQSIRSSPGVQVVILNHPLDIHSGFRPFGRTNFNMVSGENLRGPPYSFDALEVINSGAMQSDWMLPFRAWFALLNHGYHFTAVGASDSHDVSRFIVGQGRTYIAMDDGHPESLDVDRASKNLREGRALVSLGLLTKITVNGSFGPGELATGLGKTVRVKVQVLAPSWITPDRVELFANGELVRQWSFAGRNRGGRTLLARNKTNHEVSWDLPCPGHDLYLVAVASGPGVTGPYWPIARPFQPSSRRWQPRVIGATNPVWLDADGDSNFTSAHRYAALLVEQSGANPDQLVHQLAHFDRAVSVQAASICAAAGHNIRGTAFVRALKDGPDFVRQAFAEFSATVGDLEGP